MPLYFLLLLLLLFCVFMFNFYVYGEGCMYMKYPGSLQIPPGGGA